MHPSPPVPMEDGRVGHSFELHSEASKTSAALNTRLLEVMTQPPCRAASSFQRLTRKAPALRRAERSLLAGSRDLAAFIVLAKARHEPRCSRFAAGPDTSTVPALVSIKHRSDRCLSCVEPSANSSREQAALEMPAPQRGSRRPVASQYLNSRRNLRHAEHALGVSSAKLRVHSKVPLGSRPEKRSPDAL